MPDVLLLHGKPSRERYEDPEVPMPHEANWFPWMAAELGRRGITAAIPVLPKPFHPEFEAWRQEVERFSVGRETSVVGHSAGAEFALRWLSEEQDVRLAKLVLVAPWADVHGKYGGFSDYELDPGIPERVDEVVIFNSVDDSAEVNFRAHYLHDHLVPSRYVEFDNYGHFMLGNNMESVEFPELFDEVVR